MTRVHVYENDSVASVDAPARRPLRWAAWRADGSQALLVGNRGEALAFDGASFQRLQTDSEHNLRGVAWSPDGAVALLVGNRGAVLRYDGNRFDELAPATTENLRRVAWSPDGSCALIAGNNGAVLRYDAATTSLTPLPGDRAHTLRSIAWRPDGEYALIGAYASRYAGYPRPHALYRCDGRYTQALLATDDEDDVVAIDWQPRVKRPSALCIVLAYAEDDSVTNKLLTYDGGGFTSVAVEAPGALLGGAWDPGGGYALLCGEGGALFRLSDGRMTAIHTGTRDNLVGPFWRPGHASALLLKGPDEKVFTV